jgi:hypothetical protein
MMALAALHRLQEVSDAGRRTATMTHAQHGLRAERALGHCVLVVQLAQVGAQLQHGARARTHTQPGRVG